jgi:predicted lipoprotein
MLRASLVVAFALFGTASAQTTTSGERTPVEPVATEADYARAVTRVVHDTIIPAYERLDVTSAALARTTQSYCTDSDIPSRLTVEAAFASTVNAWAAVDFLRFGPMAEDGRYERFAFFPDVHGTGARQLRRFLASEDQALLEPGALAAQSAAVQGLPALESLFYSGAKALLKAETPEPFRCALAAAIAENLYAIAGEALAGWKAGDGWAILIDNPGPDNPVYRTHAEAMTEIVKAIITGLEQDREHRLLPALGETPGDGKASRAPFNASGLALRYLIASAEALELFAQSSGLLAMLPDNQKSYADSALFEFSNLKNALHDSGWDLEAALADPQLRSRLSYATIVLASLRDIFQRHISVAAGLTPGFNSLDGD